MKVKIFEQIASQNNNSDSTIIRKAQQMDKINRKNSLRKKFQNLIAKRLNVSTTLRKLEIMENEWTKDEWDMWYELKESLKHLNSTIETLRPEIK